MKRLISTSAFTFATIALWVTTPGFARADILPPGAKGVKNSLAVEGKIPAGKGLLIANTFVGATPARPGAAVAVSWHPLSGPMRLMLVSTADAAKVPETDDASDNAERKAIAEKGIPCSEPFSGTRTLPDTSPADEVRLVFHVEATATTCSATLVRTEYRSKDGRDVGAAAGSASVTGSAAPSAPWEPPQPESANAPLDPSPAAGVPPPRSGCAGCALPGDSHSEKGWFAAMVAVGLVSLRRRLRC